MTDVSFGLNMLIFLKRLASKIMVLGIFSLLMSSEIWLRIFNTIVFLTF